MFEGINNLFKYLDYLGICQTLYQISVWVTYLVIILYFILYRKNYSISLRDSVLIPACIFPPAYLTLLLVTFAETGFRHWGSNNIVRIFVLIPLFAIPASKILKISVKTLTDVFAPAAALIQGFGHIVCPVAGCCHGYPCEWGIWNRQTNTILFPNQWLECLVALGVMVAVMLYEKKHHYDSNGKGYPLFLILFGSTRFLLEFLRDEVKLFWGISELALHALFMVVVGIVWLILNQKAMELKEKLATEKVAKKASHKKKRK